MTYKTMSLGFALLRAPLLAVFACVALGVVVADATALSVGAAGVTAATTLLVLAFAVRRRRGVLLVALAVFAALGALASALTATPAPPAITCAAEATPWRARVQAVLGRKPRSAGRGLERQVLLDLEAQRCLDGYHASSGRVRASLPMGDALARGDRLEMKLVPSPLEAARNPTQADPLLLARRDQIGGQAIARSPYAFVSRATGLAAATDRARDHVAALIEEHFDPDDAAVAKALATGDQSAVSPNQRSLWADAGLAHILSVSGLHLTLVATVIYWLVYQLLACFPLLAERVSVRRFAALLTLVPTLGFCLWVGAPAAAVRATVMAGSLYGAIVLGRPKAVPNALGLAGVAIVLAAPTSLYDPGFLLSFVAVGMLLTLPRLDARRSRGARLLAAVAGLLLTSVFATAATLPVSAYYFGRVSLIAPLANLVGVPLGSAVATPLALAYCALGGAGGLVEFAVRLPLAASLHLLNALATVAARVPFAALDLPRPSAFAIVSYYLLVLGLLGLRRRAGRRLAVFSAMALGVAVAVQGSQLHPGGMLRLSLPYVGQGEATLIEFPAGGVALVDAGGASEAGGYDPGLAVLVPLLRQRGIRSLDLAVVTHPHPDHLEGFAALAERIPIEELWWNGEGGDLPTMRRVLDLVHARGGRTITVADLPTRQEREGVGIEFVHPRTLAGDGPPFAELDSNNNSIALRLTYGARSVLLAADVGLDAEEQLVSRLAATDILKVGHHGSRTATGDAWLAALAPRLALITCGSHNRFGFPHAQVLNRLADHGVTVWRTDLDGLIELATDGRSWTASSWRGRRLRWPEP